MTPGIHAGVSVIIPTFNRAHLVPRAITSALHAIVPGDEIILIDDGSEDDTEYIARRFGSAIRYVKTKNRGAGPARNLGIQMARHELIAFLDSDDEWLSQHLYLHRTYHSVEDVHFSFSNFDAHYDNEPSRKNGLKKLTSWTKDFRSWDDILGPGIPYSRFEKVPDGWADFKVHTGYLYGNMMLASYVPAWTSLVRKDLTKDRFYFPDDLPTFEDWECFIRLSKGGKAAYLDCATAINHVHSGGRLSAKDTLTMATTCLKILERNYGTDHNFLNRREEEYQVLVRQLKGILIKQLVIRGDTRAARKEIQLLKETPFSVKALSALPGPAAKLICSTLSAIRGNEDSD
jgi:glycosyltransferase involved in cell wall biosynthesis